MNSNFARFLAAFSLLALFLFSVNRLTRHGDEIHPEKGNPSRNEIRAQANALPTMPRAHDLRRPPQPSSDLEAIHRPSMENPIRSMKTIYPRQSHSPVANGRNPLRLYLGILTKTLIRYSEKRSTSLGSIEKRRTNPPRGATESKIYSAAANWGNKESNATEELRDDTSTQRSEE